MHNLKETSIQDCEEALEESLTRLRSLNFPELRSLPALDIDTAREFIDRHPLRALDAIQLAACCSVRAVSGITDIVFIASDHALLAAAVLEGLQTMDPAAALS
jgi:predicted nucleic acid-binding protein